MKFSIRWTMDDGLQNKPLNRVFYERVRRGIKVDHARDDDEISDYEADDSKSINDDSSFNAETSGKGAELSNLSAAGNGVIGQGNDADWVSAKSPTAANEGSGGD